jgi:hypothetical protein
LAYYVDPTVINRRGWVRTTFGFGGWFYYLNDVTNAMTNGVQVNGDVKLELEPEFVYDNGVPYLQITHKLTNNGSTRLINQKFGASADVMIYGNDRAPLTYLPYGVLMTDEYTTYGGVQYYPTIKFRLICQELGGVDNASTLWLGGWESGRHRNYVYTDQRENITDIDSALCFSYQDIELNPGETKTFVVRFTQVQ